MDDHYVALKSEDWEQLCKQNSELIAQLTTERNALRADSANRDKLLNATLDQRDILRADNEQLRKAVERALSDLECAELKCWCFTRAAMNRAACECANCKVWAVLSKAKPVA
jgi:hypothetical protein